MLKRAVLIALLSLSAVAEEKPGVKVIQEPDKVVVRKRTVIDFNEVRVRAYEKRRLARLPGHAMPVGVGLRLSA